MAAKAIQISHTSKKRSNRIRAANNFLSNISLDGSVSNDSNKKEKVKTTASLLNKEQEEILSNVNFVLPPLLQRPKLLTSFSATNASEDEENIDPSVSLSSTNTFQKNNSLMEVTYSRTMSLKDSNIWANNLTHIANKHLRKYQGRLPGKRIMLCSAHSVPFAVYSTLKYTHQGKKESQDKNTYRLRRMSGENDCNSYGIKGVDMGTQEKPVSYGHLLVPTSNISMVPRGYLSPRKNTMTPGSPVVTEFSLSSFKSNSFGSNSDISCSSPGVKTSSPRGTGYTREQPGLYQNYDPLLLDDPELRSGRHRKVLHLSSFMVSIIEYAKPSQLKKDLNEQFKEKFPNMEISLSKLRSLKYDLIRLSTECLLDHSTIAFAFVYFEKLVLWGKINKINRKLVAGSCLLLAAKFNNDLNKTEVQQLISKLSDCFRVSTTDLFLFEIQALIALEFNLHLPSCQILPHIKRLEYGVTSFI